MSKSLGNALDPIHVIEGRTLGQLQDEIPKHLEPSRYRERLERLRKEFPNGLEEGGADALRFTLLSLLNQGKAIACQLASEWGLRLTVPCRQDGPLTWICFAWPPTGGFATRSGRPASTLPERPPTVRLSACNGTVLGTLRVPGDAGFPCSWPATLDAGPRRAQWRGEQLHRCRPLASGASQRHPYGG